MVQNRSGKIAIIGPYPPPYGGISVHLSRIVSLLSEEDFILYNISKKSKIGKRFFGLWKYIYLITFLFKSYKVIHYHSTSSKIRLLLSMVSYFKTNVYLHLHGESFSDLLKGRGLTPYLIKKLIPYTNYIASNSTIYNQLKGFNPLNLYQYDAFIPPMFDQDIYNKFYNNYSIPKSKFIICMVGWFSKYKGEDLYGFDIALDALKILTEEHLDVSIVASINGINDKDLYNSFLKKRVEYNLIDNFLIIEDSLDEVYPVYLNSNLFIRPTNTDGNSVSIKEALWFETPVIASDCVIRPTEAVLFKNRDANDLAEKIMQVINQDKLLSSQEKIEICGLRTFNYPLIKDIYGLEQ